MVIIILNSFVQIFFDPPFPHRVKAADDVDCLVRLKTVKTMGF
jgi:hypothetical protein